MGIPLPALHVGQGVERIQSPLERMMRVEQLRNAQQQGQMGQLQLEEAQQQQQEEQAVRAAMQQAGGDARKALRQIMQVSPRTGTALQKRLADWDAKDAETKLNEIKLGRERQRAIGDIALRVTDQNSYVAGLREAVGRQLMSEQEAQQLSQQPWQQVVEGQKQQAQGMEKWWEGEQKRIEDERRAKLKNQELTEKEKNFQASYQNWLAAEHPGEKPNAKLERAYRLEYDKQQRQRVPQLLTPEEEAQKKRIARETRSPALQLIQTTDLETGQPVQRFVEKRAGAEFTAKPTSGQLEKAEARAQIAPAVDELQSIGERIITQRSAAAQKGVSTVRAFEAAVANDPDWLVYQSAAAALAMRLSVLIQGSRPSDVDLAAWQKLVPSPFTDTADSAKAKWEFIRNLAHLPRQDAIKAAKQRGLPTGAPQGGPKVGDTKQYQGATYKFDGTQWVKQ